MGILESLLEEEPDIEYTGRDAAATFIAANDVELDDGYPEHVRLYEEDDDAATYRYEIEYVEDVDFLPAPRPRTTVEGTITDPKFPDAGEAVCRYCHDTFDTDNGRRTHEGMQHEDS